MSTWSSLETLTRLKEGLELTVLVAGFITAVAAVGIWIVGQRLTTLQAAKDAELRGRVSAAEERQKDRRLTDEQRAAIKRGLEATPKGRIVIVSMATSPETNRYALDFDEVLRDAGWTSHIQAITWLPNTGAAPPTGLILAMENPRAIPPYINPLFKAIENAGVPVKAQTAPRLVQDESITLVVAFKP